MYELMLILDIATSEESRKRLFQKIEKLIGAEGKVKETIDLGKKNLAYKIKKKTEGHYFLMTLSMLGKEAAAISDKLKMEEAVLRYLLVRKEK